MRLTLIPIALVIAIGSDATQGIESLLLGLTALLLIAVVLREE